MRNFRKIKPGEVREGRIPVFDSRNRMRGHVGPSATQCTALRMTGGDGGSRLKLNNRRGRLAWEVDGTSDYGEDE
jgi:hypothetical protein